MRALKLPLVLALSMIVVVGDRIRGLRQQQQLDNNDGGTGGASGAVGGSTGTGGASSAGGNTGAGGHADARLRRAHRRGRRGAP